MLRSFSGQPQSKSQLDIRGNGLSKRDSFGSAATLNSSTRYNTASPNKLNSSPTAKPTLSPSKSNTTLSSPLSQTAPKRPLRRRDTLRERDTQSQTRSTLNRRESFGSNTFIANQLGGPRRDSFGSTLSRGDSLDLKLSKRDSFDGRGDLRRQSFGGSLYLRPDSTGSTNLIRRDSFGSQNLRKESSPGVLNNGSSVFLRADSSGAGNLIRRDSLGGSQHLRRDSLHNPLGSNKLSSFSSKPLGSTNLLRRDSLGSQSQVLRRDSLASNNSKNNYQYRASVPRDYVSKSQSVDRDGHTDSCAVNQGGHHHPEQPHRKASILRKDSIKSTKKHVSYEEDTVDSSLKENHLNRASIDSLAHQLTAANLTKHSTIMEENLKNERMKSLAKKLSFDEDAARIISTGGTRRERTNSTGSAGSAYLASRRISVDSLDTRRNSWQRRGSHSSADIDFTRDILTENGVSYTRINYFDLFIKLTQDPS